MYIVEYIVFRFWRFRKYFVICTVWISLFLFLSESHFISLKKTCRSICFYVATGKLIEYGPSNGQLVEPKIVWMENCSTTNSSFTAGDCTSERLRRTEEQVLRWLGFVHSYIVVYLRYFLYSATQYNTLFGKQKLVSSVGSVKLPPVSGGYVLLYCTELCLFCAQFVWIVLISL